MKQLLALLITVYCAQNFGYTQETDLHLNSGIYKSEQLTESATASADELINNHFYRIAFFKAIPNDEVKKELKSAGIELLKYLPRNHFFVRLAIDYDSEILPENSKLYVINPEYKLSKNLFEQDFPSWSLTLDGKVLIDAFCYRSDDFEEVEDQLRAITTVLASTKEQLSFQLGVDIEKLDQLYQIHGLRYFETIPEPGSAENTTGRTNHRANSLRTEYDGGLFYRGGGVKIMMSDDGYIGDHIDYQGRIDQSACFACSSDDADNHGDHVAGIIMGAGNLDPKARGMADGADLLVFGYNTANYATFVPNLYSNEELVITSTSYSNGCNAGYTSLASTLDQQVRQMPSLMHVFSAGNDGTSDCSYGAGAGWGNITGGHKSGKNVLCVGNLTATDNLSSSSSRGPATDGRIKPDICGVGSSVFSTISDNTYDVFSGTSMSCPGVAGITAQLYEAYRDDFGQDPNSGLIKACILNTGEDLGNSGPDFQYGWGRINARRAYETFHQGQFLSDQVTQGGSNVHNINVPSGVSEVRIMAYWTDYEGASNASVALVNDLNMVVTDPSMTDFEPWVLDPTPNPVNLDALAIRAVDNLNNMEQVTIDNPTPGNYTVNIAGFAVPQGPQEYFIVYYFVRDEITLTYPNGGEGIESGNSEIIRWDAKDDGNDFTVELSEDNGGSWSTIAVVNHDRLYMNWVVPNTVSGLAKVRITRGAASDESDAVFSIIDTPTNLEILWSCPDSAKFQWTGVNAATGYEVSMLGNKYMDSIGTTTGTSFTLNVPSTDDLWVSVKALGPDNAVGERAIAIRRSPGEFGCLWSDPSADFSVDCENGGTEYCVTLTNESINADATSEYTYYFPGGTPSTSTDENPQVCYSVAGDYAVAMVVDNGFGIDSVYLTGAIHVSTTASLPYYESFESYSNFVNLDEWSVENPDGNQEFQITGTAALSGNQSARLFNYTQTGNFVDELVSGPIDLSVLSPSEDITLSFRYAYRKQLEANDEWLKVFITQSCSDAWVQRKTIHGSQLSDLISTSSWTPSSASDWTTVHMTNVTSSYFTGDFRMKFTFESNEGNNFYLDDINIYQGQPSEEIITVGLEESAVSSISIYPVPADEELNIAYTAVNSGVTEVIVQDLSGKQVFQRAVQSAGGKNLIVIDSASFSAGIYFVTLRSGEISYTKKVIID